jgi:DnaJ-class molecular chaperone
MDFKDYYATLGVPKTATDKELKQAYRKLARKHHPDVNPGDKAAEAKFKEINEAYEVLGDPEKRRKYDELGANWRAYEQAERAGAANPFEQGGWTVNMGGGSGGFRTMTEEEMQEMFGTDNPFSDFFNTFFGGGGGTSTRGARTSRSRARKGRDLEHELPLTLEEADQGVTRRFSIKHDGHARTVDVRVPAGVGDGSRVRVGGEGEPGTGGATAGDLYLRVRLEPHSQFERKGRDLYTRISVPLTTAVLGGEVNVPALGGRTLRLKMPPTTQNGQVFRLRGQGMSLSSKPGERSDLYATVDVELPRQLTPEERTHFEELAKIEKKKHSAA